MDASPLDPSLVDRLTEVGLDPANFGDPRQAWQRLHHRFGRRATLIDRYALEAARRGVRPEQLAPDERTRLTREVLSVQYPGIEFAAASGRPVADPVEVVPYRAEWADSFEAWRRRLSEALGKAAVRIKHVGSTAVPGLEAKPIIDIQVSVVDVEDEDAYVPAIETLGVSLRFREPGHRYFRPAGDQPRTVHIHVCNAAGSSTPSLSGISRTATGTTASRTTRERRASSSTCCARRKLGPRGLVGRFQRRSTCVDHRTKRAKGSCEGVAADPDGGVGEVLRRTLRHALPCVPRELAVAEQDFAAPAR